MTSESSVSEAMREQIRHKVNDLAQQEAITILFAVESGSRAWGFASPDSDYDVRFVYKRGIREYVQVGERRDVIELPLIDDLDINGWDIVKALTLFRKSNPPLLEWLHSPIVYQQNGNFANELRALAATHYSVRRMVYHYLNMAKRNYQSGIADRVEVSLKKYLYVMRPLACIRWLEQQSTPPPTALPNILHGIEWSHEVRHNLDELLVLKSRAGEVGTGAHNTVLDAFIEAELERIGEAVVTLPDAGMALAPLDELLWNELGI